MSRVCFGDVVHDVKVNVDRLRNPYEYYVAGDHMDTEELRILRRGKFSEPPEPGPAFTRVFKPGQILYGSRRTYLKKVAVADFEGICANTTFVLETKDGNVFLQRLLPFLMYSDRFTQYSINNSKGSTNPYILFSDLAKYEFELPPLAEQHKLADLLWAINSTREAYKKLLDLTDEVVKSRFVEMFGDIFCRSAKYPKQRIATVIDDNIAKVGRTYSTSDNIKYIDITSIDNGRNEIVQYTDYTVENAPSRAQQVVQLGDVLISTVRPILKNVAVIRDRYENLVASTGFCVLRPIELINVEYLFAIVSSDAFAEYLARIAKGANYPAVNGSNIKDFMIPLPPLSLQNRFAEFVRQAEKSKFELQRTIGELEATYKSILRENLG